MLLPNTLLGIPIAHDSDNAPAGVVVFTETVKDGPTHLTGDDLQHKPLTSDKPLLFLGTKDNSQQKNTTNSYKMPNDAICGKLDTGQNTPEFVLTPFLASQSVP